MCEACRAPRKARFEGSNIILQKVACNCKCPNGEIVFGEDTRCNRCTHLIEIELTDMWQEPNLHLNKAGEPIAVNSIQPSMENQKGSDEN